MLPGTGPRTIGVEEEFHLVDAATRRLVSRAPELLAHLPDDAYVAELQRCVVEVNSRVVRGLDDLGEELRARRRVLVAAATEIGLGVVAAGAVPLSVPAELQVTGTPRFRRMLSDYQLLAREQLICGSQVHVGIPERDQAVTIGNRVAPYLPTLLALSASSPFWSDGTDTGYASARTLVWQRWPTTGLSSSAATAQDYDQMIEDVISSGVITDPGMVYFDVRPSSKIPTLELRICDSCPSVDTIVLIAGLFRALVDREIAADSDGRPALDFTTVLGRAAVWRAVRSGLDSDLVDVESKTAKPAGQVIHELIEALAPQLEASGDYETVLRLADDALRVGTSSARQRRALRRRGRLTDVVDQLLAETAGRGPVVLADDDDPTLLHGYRADLLTVNPATAHQAVDGDAYDEAVGTGGLPRPNYERILPVLGGLGAHALREREMAIEHEQRMDGITFRVSGQSRAQLFPVDVVPRIVSAADWQHVSIGLAQRAKALDAFLNDIYGEQQVVADGGPAGRGARPGTGLSLQRTGPGTLGPGPHQWARSGLRRTGPVVRPGGQSADPVRHRLCPGEPTTADRFRGRDCPPAGRGRAGVGAADPEGDPDRRSAERGPGQSATGGAEQWLAGFGLVRAQLSGRQHGHSAGPAA